MLLTVLEVAFLLLGVAGVALWSVPLAMVVAAVVGVAACEVAQRRAVEQVSDPAGEGRG